MAPRASGGIRAGKNGRSRAEDFRAEAQTRAAETNRQPEAVVAYPPMKSVRIPAYAKVNLRLDVLGRRADGFHELRTIFQAISLHDTLVLEARREPGVDLRIDGNAQLAGEPGKDNLVYRALDELGRELGLRQ